MPPIPLSVVEWVASFQVRSDFNHEVDHGPGAAGVVGSLVVEVGGTAAVGVRSRSLSQEPAGVVGGGALPTTTTGRSCPSENASVVSDLYGDNEGKGTSSGNSAGQGPGPARACRFGDGVRNGDVPLRGGIRSRRTACSAPPLAG